ncbi:MAG TPA: Gfo/Idh/MocA family oxidoreductase [Acidobacteriota bacterium]|nr:Gfo/Idh/MocA family oxidoreductase [Acidobacteriota bacterium]
MEAVSWGMIGCGDVTEVKSGPGFQKADYSTLVAVMERDGTKARDYARRHGVARSYDRAEDLIMDPGVDAVYIATPPSSHCELALQVATAGKPCLVEKPMARNHRECRRMVEYFRQKELPLFVAFYRRGLPRFLKVRDLVQDGAIGTLTSVHILHYDPLVTGEAALAWRFNPEIAGAGLFLDLASHGLDLLDFFAGPIQSVHGFARNTGGSYRAEDTTAACFEFACGAVGTGVWNFNSDHSDNRIVLTGSKGEIVTPVFADGDVLLRRNGVEEVFPFRNPPHVHQPLIQTVVNDLLGRGKCESTGESAARTSWVMDRCLESYYGSRGPGRKADS